LNVVTVIKDSADFKLALFGAQEDLKKIGRTKSVMFLEQLQHTLQLTR
jgi:hypothetical protein